MAGSRAHSHSHAHGGGHFHVASQAARPASPRTVLTLSGGVRLAVALGASALLWLLMLWAMAA